MNRPGPSLPVAWTVIQVNPNTGQTLGREIPAQVPGDVFSDLERAGLIIDPYIGHNSTKARWVHDFDWLYRGGFDARPDPDRRAWLDFAGLDYRYTISFNGEKLLSREGMFAPVRLDVTRLLRDRNEIEVRFAGFPDRFWETKFPPVIINTEPVRRRVLKTQMSFGWDFAPPLKTCGIWDEARVFTTGPVRIDDLWVRTANDGTMDLELLLDCAGSVEAELEFTVAGETFAGGGLTDTKQVAVDGAGVHPIRHRMRIESPRLWDPWDQGAPELYRIGVTARVAGEVSDEAAEVFGFREIGWERNPGSPASARDWTLTVNGRRVFMRGANWVPAESLPGRLTNKRYRKLINMAREANLNTLRLWGGGNRERAVFYETCDRLGILVWQEFPLGCLNFGAPRSPAYLELLDRECAAIVRSLRNHPSVMMWCGGNEFNVHLSRPALKVMDRVCREHGPDRRFVPASPYRGDAHNWLVWHLRGNLDDYARDPAQVVSEFGLQAPPDLESLREFLPGELLWPIGPAWRRHHLGRGKMDKYVNRFGGPAATVEQYVDAGQEAQAHYLHRAIERWRRAKYRKSGALVWQWNEPWPAISWAVVDYYLRPKKSYDRLRLAFQPLLVCADFESKKYGEGDQLGVDLWLVNDFPRAFDGLEIEVRVNGTILETVPAAVAADEAKRAGRVALTLAGPAPHVLELTARAGNEVVSDNRYRLDRHDPDGASRLARRLFKRWWQFLSE